MKRTFLLGALVLGACMDPGESGNLVPKTVDEDPALPRIAIGDTLLHSEAYGDPDAPMVIVLHGGPGGDYRSLLPLSALANDGYYVVFWDQRGTGLSKRHDADAFSNESYLGDLRQVIAHYSANADQPFVLIGQSWGAMYATWFINEHGDYGGRIKGAILTEPGAFTKAQLDDFMDGFVGSFDLTGEQLNDAFWARQFMSPADHARADYLAQVIQIGGVPSEMHDPDRPTPGWRAGAVASQATLELANKGFDWTTNLAAYPREVLFLRGDKNTVATLEHQTKLAASYPNAQIVTIPNVGHEAIWERSDDYLARTREYFQRISFHGVTP